MENLPNGNKDNLLGKIENIDMMLDEEIDATFGDVIQSAQILLAKGCVCSKPWDYCL